MSRERSRRHRPPKWIQLCLLRGCTRWYAHGLHIDPELGIRSPRGPIHSALQLSLRFLVNRDDPRHARMCSLKNRLAETRVERRAATRNYVHPAPPLPIQISFSQAQSWHWRHKIFDSFDHSITSRLDGCSPPSFHDPVDRSNFVVCFLAPFVNSRLSTVHRRYLLRLLVPCTLLYVHFRFTRCAGASSVGTECLLSASALP